MCQFIAIFMAAAVLGASADAVLVVTNVVEDPGNMKKAIAIYPDMDGALMAGAKVEITSGGGALVETVYWHATGANSGQAEGSLPDHWRQ